MAIPERFRAFLVTKDAAANSTGRSTTVSAGELPPGELLLRVACSSVNFKDALSYSGHRGVTSKFPHVPGIDAVGVVEQSEDSAYPQGSWVIVTGHDFGMNHWGGYAEYARVPVAWTVPLPAGMTPFEAMQLGTAGLTAAQSVEALLRHDVKPSDGPVLVSGASGGVAVVAIALLARVGFEVVATTRKSDVGDRLRALGATEVLPAERLSPSDSPLMRERWSGVVDTVGGPALEHWLKTLRYAGVVTTCGMVGGDRFSSSVFPFILRGTTLVGIDSVRMPFAQRVALWRKLAEEWRVDLSSCTESIGLEDLPQCLDALLRGRHFGRAVVKLGGDT